jgi:uncharacterized damage-inducible protein DinB
MQRPQTGEFNPYFQRYIDLVVDGDFDAILEENTDEAFDFFQNIPEDKHNFRYEEGKWSIKEVLMHIIDTERVMAYRALVASRGDKTPLPSFDENAYNASVDVSERSMDSLLYEFQAVRSNTVALFDNMTEAQTQQEGIASNHAVTPRALGYIIVGHVLHHIKVTNERYL